MLIGFIATSDGSKCSASASSFHQQQSNSIVSQHNSSLNSVVSLSFSNSNDNVYASLGDYYKEKG
jgi:hypothetical protein